METINHHVAEEERKVAEEEKNGLIGWSWGAFMLELPFLIAIKRYMMLFWYLLLLIPFVNVVFIVAFKIYMGVKGRAMAATSTQFGNESEFRGFMNGFDHAGKILFIVVVVALAITLLLGIFGIISFLTLSSRMHGGLSPFSRGPLY